MTHQKILTAYLFVKARNASRGSEGYDSADFKWILWCRHGDQFAAKELIRQAESWGMREDIA